MAKVVDFEHYAYVRAGWADMRMRRPAGRDMRIHGPPARGYARAYEELVGPARPTSASEICDGPKRKVHARHLNAAAFLFIAARET